AAEERGKHRGGEDRRRAAGGEGKGAGRGASGVRSRRLSVSRTGQGPGRRGARRRPSLLVLLQRVLADSGSLMGAGPNREPDEARGRRRPPRTRLARRLAQGQHAAWHVEDHWSPSSSAGPVWGAERFAGLGPRTAQ